jgi:hypothetical protein
MFFLPLRKQGTVLYAFLPNGGICSKLGEKRPFNSMATFFCVELSYLFCLLRRDTKAIRLVNTITSMPTFFHNTTSRYSYFFFEKNGKAQRSALSRVAPDFFPPAFYRKQRNAVLSIFRRALPRRLQALVGQHYFMT